MITPHLVFWGVMFHAAIASGHGRKESLIESSVYWAQENGISFRCHHPSKQKVKYENWEKRSQTQRIQK